MIPERRPLRTLTAEDVAAWRDLASRAVEPNPFFEPAFVMPAWQHVGGRGLELLVVRDGPRWLACLPVRRAARFRKVPGPALSSWIHTHCPLGTPLVDRADPVGALRSLLRHAGRDPLSGYLVLELLGDGGPVAEALHQALHAEGLQAILYERSERAALHRREDRDYVNPLLPGRHGKEARRRRRNLEAELGPVAVRDRGRDPAAIDAFLDLEAAGWKGAAGTALIQAGHGVFFGELCRAFAADGRLQLLALEAGDRTAAMRCDLLAGDGVFSFKIAHDESLKRFGPGVLLELENLEVFHATPGVTWSDSCASEHSTVMNGLWRDRRAVATVLVPGAHRRGRAARQVIRAALRARAALAS